MIKNSCIFKFVSKLWKKRRNKLELITQNLESIINTIVFIALLVTIMLFLIKHNEQSYKGFPFDMKDLDKFHEITENKVIPQFESKLKTKLTRLNVRDICQKDYKLSENFILRFTYIGEIFLVENLTKKEEFKGNLKKIPDFGKLISNIKTIAQLHDAMTSTQKKPSES